MKGHIREIGPGRYQVMFDIPPDPVTGRRRQRSRVVRGTRKEAEAALADLIAEVEAMAWIDDGSMTVAGFAEMWLEARRHQLEPTTLDGYRQKAAHLVANLGHRKLKAVTGGVLSALYGRLLDKGLSGQSVLHVHRVAHKMFTDAVRWGYLRANPADGADPPRARPAERPTWDRDTARRFLEAVEGHRWEVAWWLALGAGLRRSEVCGLTKPHVLYAEQVLEVRRTLVVVEGRDVWSGPKTEKSRRDVAIDAAVVAKLRENQRRHAELQLADPGNWANSEDTVVAWEDGRRVHPDRLSAEHRRMVRRLGFPPIAFHDLRHTYATLAREAGVEAKVVSEMLGHSSVLITLDRYTHKVAALHREAAAAIAGLLAT